MKRLIKSVLAAMAGISMLVVGCKGPETPVVSELTGITIKSAPAKTTYEVDAALDLTGIVITAAYSAGDPVDIEYSDETKEKIAASGFDSAKIGNPVVTVTYTEGEASKTATFKTSVIKTVPNEDGTTTVTKFNDDGATVATTTDANGDVVKTETTVEAEGVVTVTTENADGSSVVAVTDADGAKTTTSKDKDGNVTSVVEEKKDEAGNSVKVEIVYDAEGGRTETTTVIGADGKETKTEEKYNKDGDKVVVGDDGKEVVITLDSIAITTKPTKLEYTVGDKFAPAGIKVTATYSDKSTKDVTSQLTDKSYTGFDSSAAKDKQTITVTYSGKTAAFDIVIKAKAETPPAEEGGETGGDEGGEEGGNTTVEYKKSKVYISQGWGSNLVGKGDSLLLFTKQYGEFSLHEDSVTFADTFTLVFKEASAPETLQLKILYGENKDTYTGALKLDDNLNYKIDFTTFKNSAEETIEVSSLKKISLQKMDNVPCTAIIDKILIGEEEATLNIKPDGWATAIAYYQGDVTFSNGYGGITIGDGTALKDDKITIEFEEVPTKVQLKVVDKGTEKDDDGNYLESGAHYGNGEITTMSVTYVFEKDAEQVLLQAKNDPSATAKIKSVTLERKVQ